MQQFLLALVFAFLLSSPFEVNANQTAFGFGKVFFGTSEKIDEIQDLQGTDFKLCHKYTFHFFLAGIYLTDDGYVLQKKGDPFRYLPLDKEKTSELQKSGALPNPLPKYSIPVGAYLAGYSLWLIILVIISGSLFWSWYAGASSEYCKNCKTEITLNDRKLGECQLCHTPVKPTSDPTRSIT